MIKQVIDVVYHQLLSSPVFYGHGADNAWDEAVNLVIGGLGLPLDTQLEDVADNEITLDQRQQIEALVQQRCEQRIPLAYLIKQTTFAGLPFYIDERALIPRSPIAELIEQGFSPWLKKSPQRILDLCTGGGCIAIACAMAFPEAVVDAVDISEDALAVARKNVTQHAVAERVHLYAGDLFQPLEKGVQYDLIVSNPPYVSSEEMRSLPEEYQHEPELALAAGEAGLDIVGQILQKAVDYLADDGIIIVEVGNSAQAVQQAYPNLPLIWLEFANGGDGVFLLEKKCLEIHSENYLP